MDFFAPHLNECPALLLDLPDEGSALPDDHPRRGVWYEQLDLALPLRRHLVVEVDGGAAVRVRLLAHLLADELHNGGDAVAGPGDQAHALVGARVEVVALGDLDPGSGALLQVRDGLPAFPDDGASGGARDQHFQVDGGLAACGSLFTCGTHIGMRHEECSDGTNMWRDFLVSVFFLQKVVKLNVN